MITDRVIPPEIKERIRILVVEDNLLCRKLIGFMISNWGFKYDAVANGKAALENLKLEPYDLVIMDIQMPEMNGYDAARKIRSKLNLAMPIIAVTSHASEEERQKCLSAGMNDYLAKPISEEALYNLTVNYLFVTAVDSASTKGEKK
jgi:two-component system sensor histidine kinase/response regulator